MTPIFVVDAFTDGPFSGNPAGVCLLDAPAEAAWMQAVAEEMKHAETAFLWPEGDAYRLRWFTPTVEVDLCGHATLASAHVLHQERGLPEVRFRTLSGVLSARAAGEGITLDFPAEPVAECDLPWMPKIAEPMFMGRNRMDWFLEVADEAALRTWSPDYAAIEAMGMRGFIVTARSSTGCDFVSRFFAPQSGVPEDPVTGSAHCALFPHWQAKLGKSRMEAVQASPRGGRVFGEVRGDRVELSGRATTFLRGTLTGTL